MMTMRTSYSASVAAEAPSFNRGLRGLRGLRSRSAPRFERPIREIRVVRVIRGSLIGGCAALGVAGLAQAQNRPTELLNEPVAIAPGFDAHMVIVNVPPAGDGPLTTAGQRGHRHPAS